MPLRGRFICASKGSRGDTDPAKIEQRVLSAFGFGLGLLAIAWNLGSTPFVWPLAGLALACMAPLLWYVCYFVKTFLGFGELGLAASEERVSGRLRARAARRCLRAAATIDALIAGEDVSSRWIAGGGMRSRSSSRPLSWVQATLSDYQTTHRPWIEDVFDEADGFGVIAPSDVELLEGRGISQLRSLSSVFRDAAAELGL
jgi:hypothetical protein